MSILAEFVYGEDIAYFCGRESVVFAADTRTICQQRDDKARKPKLGPLRKLILMSKEGALIGVGNVLDSKTETQGRSYLQIITEPLYSLPLRYAASDSRQQ